MPFNSIFIQESVFLLVLQCVASCRFHNYFAILHFDPNLLKCWLKSCLTHVSVVRALSVTIPRINCVLLNISGAVRKTVLKEYKLSGSFSPYL